MYWELTEEQKALLESVKAFVNDNIKPLARKIDEEEKIPDNILKGLGELGILGLSIPENYGGVGLDSWTTCLVVAEIAKVCGSTALTVCAHLGLCAMPIVWFGSEKQKQKYLPPLSRGDIIGSFAITEPDAGSDILGIKTYVTKKGEKLILNGSKIYITNGTIGSIYVVSAKTENDKLTLFLIDKGIPGFSQKKMHDKLGVRGSDTAELYFDNCELTEENILGEWEKGMEQLNWILQNGRLTIAGMAIGLAEGAYTRAITYATQRKQFDNFIANFQAIRNCIADMEVKLHASKLLLYNACKRKEKNLPFRKEASIAKLFASESATEIAHLAIQIHGGYGFMTEYEIERFYRDAKLTEIGEGTSEIQRLIIAKEVLKEFNFV